MSLLGGLGVVAVVLNHAMAGWDLWTIYEVAYGQDGLYMIAATARRILLEVTRFSIPSFLFISGFFAAYSSRSVNLGSHRRAISTRVFGLVTPYLVWQSIYLLGPSLVFGRPLEWEHLVGGLFLGDNISGLYYVPLLVQCYVISIPLVAGIRARPSAVLGLSGLLQVVTLLSLYWVAIGSPPWIVASFSSIASNWAFLPIWIFFFSFGVFCGLNGDRLRRLWSEYRWWILLGTVASGVLAVIENKWLADLTGSPWLYSVMRIPSSLYALGFIVCFLSMPFPHLPHTGVLHRISQRAYGIFLTHFKVLAYVARMFREISPLMHSAMPQQVHWVWVLTTALVPFSMALIVAMGCIWLVRRSPFRFVFPYLFG